MTDKSPLITLIASSHSPPLVVIEMSNHCRASPQTRRARENLWIIVDLPQAHETFFHSPHPRFVLRHEAFLLLCKRIKPLRARCLMECLSHKQCRERDEINGQKLFDCFPLILIHAESCQKHKRAAPKPFISA
jgi:hypothetical protein